MLVTSTAGEAGLSDDRRHDHADLAARRLRELALSASALGCARVEVLGYADSGSGPGAPQPGGFATLDRRAPAERLAAILREERADALTTYDGHGGYGHPDHVQVHRVGALAAELAGTPLVLEATVDRGLLRRAAAVLRAVPGARRLVPDDGFASAYLPRTELSHRVDVRRHLGAKRAALAAHHSQTTGGGSVRTVGLLLRLPPALLGPVLGREWFREPGRPRSDGPLLDDVFASLR